LQLGAKAGVSRFFANTGGPDDGAASFWAFAVGAHRAAKVSAAAIFMTVS